MEKVVGIATSFVSFGLPILKKEGIAGIQRVGKASVFELKQIPKIIFKPSSMVAFRGKLRSAGCQIAERLLNNLPELAGNSDIINRFGLFTKLQERIRQDLRVACKRYVKEGSDTRKSTDRLICICCRLDGETLTISRQQSIAGLFDLFHEISKAAIRQSAPDSQWDILPGIFKPLVEAVLPGKQLKDILPGICNSLMDKVGFSHNSAANAIANITREPAIEAGLIYKHYRPSKIAEILEPVICDRIKLEIVAAEKVHTKEGDISTPFKYHVQSHYQHDQQCLITPYCDEVRNNIVCIIADETCIFIVDRIKDRVLGCLMKNAHEVVNIEVKKRLPTSTTDN